MNHQGFTSNVGKLDFEVTLIDECANAVITTPKAFYPTSFTYTVGDPVVTYVFDLTTVSASTDGSVGYTCPQTLLYM